MFVGAPEKIRPFSWRSTINILNFLVLGWSPLQHLQKWSTRVWLSNMIFPTVFALNLAVALLHSQIMEISGRITLPQWQIGSWEVRFDLSPPHTMMDFGFKLKHNTVLSRKSRQRCKLCWSCPFMEFKICLYYTWVLVFLSRTTVYRPLHW